MCVLATVLFSASTLCEFVGVGLVARGLRDDRRHAQELLQEAERMRPSHVKGRLEFFGPNEAHVVLPWLIDAHDRLLRSLSGQLGVAVRHQARGAVLILSGIAFGLLGNVAGLAC